MIVYVIQHRRSKLFAAIRTNARGGQIGFWERDYREAQSWKEGDPISEAARFAVRMFPATKVNDFVPRKVWVSNGSSQLLDEHA